LHQAGEHLFDFGGFLGKTVVAGVGEEMKVSGEQEVVFQLTGGTAGNGAEASKLRVAALGHE
jgi:hypothetical protein